MPRSLSKFAFLSSGSPSADEAIADLAGMHDNVPVEEADVIVTLGGDGFMLECLHKFMQLGKPVYGMNRGTVGFLLNEYNRDGLEERLNNAQEITINPLRMQARRENGEQVEAVALNEVSMLRQTRQAAKLAIRVDGVTRLTEMICDGALVATPMGSTAYNLSAHGPIIPLTANALALTPISVFRPRRWRGALLPSTAQVEVEIHEPRKRPVAAVADFTEVREVMSVRVFEDRSIPVRLLFDPHRNLAERILSEQFAS